MDPNPLPLTRNQARICLTIGGRKTTDEEIDRFQAELEKGVPVMPVTFFCNFLKDWHRLSLESCPEGETEEEKKEFDRRKERYDEIRLIFIDIQKSNLLWRLIYAGEPVRTTPCPVHKGRWSGCNPPEETGCNGACIFEGNVTGWLPNGPEKKEGA